MDEVGYNPHNPLEQCIGIQWDWSQGNGWVITNNDTETSGRYCKPDGFDYDPYQHATKCDCAGNCIVALDCAGVCGGGAVLDPCFVCDGENVGDWTGFITGPNAGCDGVCWSGVVEDCAGECGGGAVVDACFVCDGGNVDDGTDL